MKSKMELVYLNISKCFFCNKSNLWYLSLVSLVLLAGFIIGMKTPQISFKEQSLADWFVAVGTFGLLGLALHTRNDWVYKKEIEHHSEFTQAFYHYYILKISAATFTKKQHKIEREIKEASMSSKSMEALKRLGKLKQELTLHKAEHKELNLEMDQAKENMLTKACILTKERLPLNSYALSLASYKVIDIISNEELFKEKMDNLYLNIQRVYYDERNLLRLP